MFDSSFDGPSECCPQGFGGHCATSLADGRQLLDRPVRCSVTLELFHQRRARQPHQVPSWTAPLRGEYKPERNPS